MKNHQLNVMQYFHLCVINVCLEIIMSVINGGVGVQGQ